MKALQLSRDIAVSLYSYSDKYIWEYVAQFYSQ